MSARDVGCLIKHCLNDLGWLERLSLPVNISPQARTILFRQSADLETSISP
jgi:hypothetical protein